MTVKSVIVKYIAKCNVKELKTAIKQQRYIERMFNCPSYFWPKFPYHVSK